MSNLFHVPVQALKSPVFRGIRLVLCGILLLIGTSELPAQSEATPPLYQQDLYQKRSLAYNFSVSLIRTVMKKRRKSQENSDEKDQWFPTSEKVKGCLIGREKIGGRDVYSVIPQKVFSDKVIIYYHGGGYTGGPYSLQWNMLAELAKESGCIAYLVDYRLAPEHPFPAGLNDSYLAYEVLGKRHGHAKLILFGDSAGGGMCLAVSQKAREAGDVMPAALILLSPWLDPGSLDPRKWEIAPNDPLLVPDSLLGSGYAYSPEGDFENPFVSPLHTDFEGLPPMLLLIGTWDILYPECSDFIARARKEKHPLIPVVAKEMFHVWPIGVGIFPEAKVAVRQMAAYMGHVGDVE